MIGLLHLSIAEGFHKVSHAINKTESDHHHHTVNDIHDTHSHVSTHQHRSISFFKTLFSNDIDEKSPVKLVFSFDKHTVKKYEYSPNFLARSLKMEPHYFVINYHRDFSRVVPPPQLFV
jgi:hypothetical protein